MTGPGTGSLKIPVATGPPLYSTMRGRATFREMSFISVCPKVQVGDNLSEPDSSVQPIRSRKFSTDFAASVVRNRFLNKLQHDCSQDVLGDRTDVKDGFR